MRHAPLETGRFPEDVRAAWRVPLAAAAAGLAVYTLSRALTFTPQLADALYGERVGPLLARPLSLLTGAVPFAVAEIVLVAYALWLGVQSARALHAVARRRRSTRNALGGGARRVLRDGGVALVAFYLLWGLNYAKPRFAEAAAWPAWNGITADELTQLATTATAAANDAYLALHGSPDLGRATPLPPDVRAFETAIDVGWTHAAAQLDLAPRTAARHGAVKWPRASGGLARLGIAGIYVPFTGEANVVRGSPAVSATISMAHEKAHQRGFTNEADANFLGFVAAALAPDPLARYAAALFAHRQLLGPLRVVAPDDAERLSAARLPGVQRDVDDVRAYVLRHTGRMQELGSGVNHRFLVANGVEGGVQAYRRSAWLIVALARQQDGAIMPGTRPAVSD